MSDVPRIVPERIVVVGTGAMGSQIAMLSALGGLDTTGRGFYDHEEQP